MTTLLPTGYPLIYFFSFAMLLSPAGFAEGNAGVDSGPDVFGGYASTHVLARVKQNVQPVMLTDGRWTFVEESDLQAGWIDNAGGIGPGEILEGDSWQLAELFDDWTVSSIEPALRVVPIDEELAAQFGLDRYYKITTPIGTDTPLLVEALGAFDSLIEIAELDGIGGHAQTIPNENEFGSFQFQYSMLNTGQFIEGQSGTPSADVNATYAWDLSTGSEDIIIALLDSGVDPHIDLGEKLVSGWNVFTMSAEPTTDVCSHGTHVAGIAAAVGNNAEGIAGMSWGARVMPVVVTDPCSSLESDVANGVIFAVNNNADILNMSLQYYAGTTFFENTIHLAHTAGVVQVAATGNNASPNVAYPAKWPETIAVAATDNRDEHWFFSNSGPEVDVAAPGVDIWSLSGTVGYTFKDGTSFATPHISGLAALIWSIDPTLSNNQVRAIIETTADDIELPGEDNFTGHGRINAFAALLATQNDSPGDLNNDGIVNGSDLGMLLGAWGDCGGCQADLTGDGVVSGADLGILLGEWG